MAEIDHRMASIKPRLKYNTIGGVNGPLVILDNVSCDERALGPMKQGLTHYYHTAGQIPSIQRNRHHNLT
jgi:hypothetical protein